MGLEPTQLESYKILSLARLPVTTLPQVTYQPSEDYNTTERLTCQQKYSYLFNIFSAFSRSYAGYKKTSSPHLLLPTF